MNSILITGGAGFIGANAVARFADRGWRVTVLDNLSRRGADDNVSWLRSRCRKAVIAAMFCSTSRPKVGRLNRSVTRA